MDGDPGAVCGSSGLPPWHKARHMVYRSVHRGLREAYGAWDGAQGQEQVNGRESSEAAEGP